MSDFSRYRQAPYEPRYYSVRGHGPQLWWRLAQRMRHREWLRRRRMQQELNDYFIRAQRFVPRSELDYNLNRGEVRWYSSPDSWQIVDRNTLNDWEEYGGPY